MFDLVVLVLAKNFIEFGFCLQGRNFSGELTRSKSARRLHRSKDIGICDSREVRCSLIKGQLIMTPIHLGRS
jgi:hypothetical protein